MLILADGSVWLKQLPLDSTNFNLMYRGGSRISGKGVHMHKCFWGSLCCLYLIFLNYPMEMKKKIGLTEAKLFHFHRIFKNGGGGGGVHANPLNPLWIRH